VGLGNLLKPRHRHRDPAVRLRAVATVDDREILIELACDDPDLDVRHRAVERLNHEDALRQVAIEGRHIDARLKAVARIDDPRVLAEIMRERKNPDLMMACFERIRSQEILEAIARDPAYNVTARRIAINMFAEPELLADILKTVRAPALREAARDRLVDKEPGRAARLDEPDASSQPDRHMDRILSNYDPVIVAEMLGAFRDSPAAVRVLGAILALGGTAGERAAEILGRVLRHARPEIRLEAVRQLHPVAGTMIEDLRSLADSEPDARVREALSRLFAKMEQTDQEPDHE